MKNSDKHEKIIRAAVKVFAKKGFFSARISDIAKAAKVADGTIYLYFNNKFDILISVFDEESLLPKPRNLLTRKKILKEKLRYSPSSIFQWPKKTKALPK